MNIKQGKRDLPPEAERLMIALKADPDTDWMQQGEWFVTRLYDDQDCGEYVVARVVHTESWGGE